MALEGLDFASSNSDPAALKASGAQFVARYLSTPGNPKNLTRPEAAKIRKAGLAIILVYEIDAQRALGGYARGKADAASARKQATACGAPARQPIYFACDWDVQPSDLPKVRSYFNGVRAGLGTVTLVGVYGGYRAVKDLLDQDACKYAWQTYAWSGGKWDPRAHLLQYQNGVIRAGIGVDLDRAVKADYGQWKPPVKRVPKPAPKPKPVPAPQPPAPKPSPEPPSAPLTAYGPKGGLLTHLRGAKAYSLLQRLAARFGSVTVRKG